MIQPLCPSSVFVQVQLMASRTRSVQGLHTQKRDSRFKVSLKVHKHENFFLTFFAETESLWSQGPVTRDF
jgi:hypothetical protein